MIYPCEYPLSIDASADDVRRGGKVDQEQDA